MLLDLKDRPTYGPVKSRRLGRSLGINPVRPGGKVCTLDCAYCHFGWAVPLGLECPPGSAFFAVEEILCDLEARLRSLPEAPAYLTFSGNGEPTLHPSFRALVDGVLELRDRLAPGAMTAILSNSTTVSRPGVRTALARLDRRIMKLDAGTEQAFARVNRPARGNTLRSVIDGLKDLVGVTLQSLFAGGPGGNLDRAQVEAWVEAVRSVAPDEVQLYTLARDTPSRRLVPAGREELEEIREMAASGGVKAVVF